MRFRQIHLDFHTSPLIPGIGSRFDAKAFAQAFKDAYVDSVTVFSKCHHGVSYHPTSVGKMHPHLEFDLLRAQIDALHAVGINAPVYLTATWDELAAFEHPEWRTVSPDGTLPMFRPEHGNGVGWAFLDFSTPYLDYLCAQTEEVMRTYPDADGIFMDISFQLPSISSSAKTKMEAQGLDWTDERDRATFTAQSVENYFTRVRDAVRKHDPKMPLFFNSGHMRRGLRKHYADFYTHLELESLPDRRLGLRALPAQRPLRRSARHPLPRHDRQVPHPLGRGRRLQEARGAPLRMRGHAGARRALLDRRPPAPDRQHRRLDHGHHRPRLQMGRRARGLGRGHHQPRRDRGPVGGGRDRRRRWSASRAITSAPTKAPSGCCSKASSPST